jgi:hypothetical protein
MTAYLRDLVSRLGAYARHFVDIEPIKEKNYDD